MFIKGSHVSLKEFHIVFISTCVLLFLGFAYWGFAQYKQLSSLVYAGTSVLSFIAAIGLVAYESYFIKKTRASDDR